MKVLVTALIGAALSCSAALADDNYKPAVKVTHLLKTTVTSSGDPIRYPAIPDPEVQTLIVEIPPGGETGWHMHPLPTYAYILSGAIEVESEDGQKKLFKAGDSFAEMVGRRHDGRVVGNEPVRILVLVTGEKDKPFTVKTDPPH